MAKKTGGNGGGASIMLSPEVHNERRRAAKRRQRKTGRFAAPGSATLMDEIRNDRAEQAEAARAAREAAQLEFRLKQAIRAIELINPTVTGLARKVAVGLIQAFPEAEVTPNIKRTEAAENTMRLTLTGEEIVRDRAIRMGISVARGALLKAYGELTAEQANTETVTITA